MLSKFDYVRPSTLEEAFESLNTREGARILAGGTDLMISLRHNVEDVKLILDVKSIPETKKMEYIPGKGLYIGASVTVNQVSRDQNVIRRYPALKQGADYLASYQLRNRATLVGNICNASPGADLAPPLLVFDAIVQIAGPKGIREVKLDKFFTGVKRTILESNEIVLGVLVPDVQENDRSTYIKQSRLKGHDLATVGVALRMDKDRKIRIAMAAVAPTPIRLVKLEEELNEKSLNSEAALWAQKEVSKHIKPISDVRSSAEYRLLAAGALLKQGLMKIFVEGEN